MYKSALLSFIIILGLFSFSCTPDKKKNLNNKITIFVSIPPQKFIVKKIADNLANIKVLLKPNSSPENFDPDIKTIKSLIISDLYLAIGYLPFENSLIPKIRENMQSKLIIISKNINLLKYSENFDPHVWLSLKACKVLARNTFISISKLIPEKKVILKKNYKKFLIEIEKYEKKIKSILDKLKNKKFLIFHPALSYFAKDYQLQQIPIACEGKSPTIHTIKSTLEQSKKYKLNVIFIQQQFSPEIIYTLTEDYNLKIEQFNPLEENILNNLLNFAVLLKKYDN